MGVVEARGLGLVITVRDQASVVHDAVGGILGTRQELLQQPRPVLADGQRLDVLLQLLRPAPERCLLIAIRTTCILSLMHGDAMVAGRVT